MAERQEDYETDTTDPKPTPGPWEIYSPHGNVLITAEGYSDNLCRMMGSREWDWKELKANAKLMAAAGTAAHEAGEMGYDPVEAVEALPKLLAVLQDIDGMIERLRYGTIRMMVNDALESAEGSGDG